MTVGETVDHQVLVNVVKVASVVSNRVDTVAEVVRHATVEMRPHAGSSSGSVQRDAPIMDLVGLTHVRVVPVQRTLSPVPEIDRIPLNGMIAVLKKARVQLGIVPVSAHAIRSPADDK